MLGQATSHTTLPVADMERAKSWYHDKLGMDPVMEDEGGARYETAGGSFGLFETQITERAGHTQMDFEVADLKAEMAELRSNGVVFEDYDMPGLKTTDGVLEFSEGAASWFKDSEGNVLCIMHQDR
ncbi:VOC family protein [Kitasatospora sp. NPDC002040]|uniref:VOC family protein n=1 Tax=Kitasatospora sp. NPDC002040 TaxID=3154661 RepID=UPI00332A2C88